ncbi:hypothetical protein F4780DRAFT_781968 [Xylariomycetidae sp. FL0641]|nr:hypothetical protein F4780DRAFT_781968 [Xylariomycetidae sp. FL0641]
MRARDNTCSLLHLGALTTGARVQPQNLQTSDAHVGAVAAANIRVLFKPEPVPAGALPVRGQARAVELLLVREGVERDRCTMIIDRQEYRCEHICCETCEAATET